MRPKISNRIEDKDVMRFFKECCNFGKGHEGKSIFFSLLYEKFGEWCSEQGYSPPNSVWFGKFMRSRIKSLRREARFEGGLFYNKYFGIDLKQKPAPVQVSSRCH
jgi:hypothetical protein